MGGRTELISCHDCLNHVSFSAVSCPHCGSREPSGPYQHNRRELRRLRAESRNDSSLILVTAAGAVLGALYGYGASTGVISELLFVPAYATLGTVLAAPLAFAITLLRRLR